MQQNILLLLALIVFQLGNAQHVEIEIWDATIPNAKSNSNYTEEVEYNDQNELVRVKNVSVPTLTIFDDVEMAQAPCVIICPGGGYKHLALNKEGYKVAEWFNSIGVKAFVLKYRLPSSSISDKPENVPYDDLERAYKVILSNADEWQIDTNKIGIMGFSAGGHLAAMGASLADFSILIYPVISMYAEITHMGSRTNLLGKNPADSIIQNYSADLQVDMNTPQTFLIHAQDDQSVPLANSLQYYEALCANQIEAELHIYQKGGHGFGMGRDGVEHPWVKALEIWLEGNILKK